MTKRNVPELRFEGFTDDWRQCKLEDIYLKIRNAFVGTATPYYVSEGYFYLESNNIKNGAINRKNEIFINEEFHEKQRDNWLKTDDLVMVQSGHVGHTAVIPPELNNTSAHAVIIISQPKAMIDSNFLNSYFQSSQAKKLIDIITTGNTIKHILASDVKKLSIHFPTYEEQTAIGKFFKQLDNTIDFHQRELKKYKNLKISYLEKMFPKENNNIPELRFDGFTDAWEQRKFQEIFDFERPDNYIVKSDKYSETGSTPVLTANKGFLLGYSHESNTYNFPSIIFDDFTLDSKYVDFPYMVKSSAIKILTTKSDYDLKFAFELLNSTKFEVLGHARHYISVVQRKNVYVPTISEQIAIGEFFKQLDNTIASHQRELKKYKKLKDGYLQKMFV